MFFGEYKHALDLKNRVIMPFRFREELGDTFMLTKGFEKCLYAMPKGEFERLLEILRKQPTADKDVSTFIRTFVASANEIEVDKQGRFLIPQNLVDFAGLEKELYITGAISRLEIWNCEKWQESSSEYERNADKIAQKLAILGF